jgi:hypothetical protein
MNRLPQPAGARQRRQARPPADRPPLAALTIRFPDGQRVEIHCQPQPNGAMTIHTTGPDGTLGEPDVAEVLKLARVNFLTTTGRRGTTAGMIFTHGGYDLDTAVTVADTLDLLAGATLAAAGITRPEDARAILTALWAAR